MSSRAMRPTFGHCVACWNINSPVPVTQQAPSSLVYKTWWTSAPENTESCTIHSDHTTNTTIPYIKSVTCAIYKDKLNHRSTLPVSEFDQSQACISLTYSFANSLPIKYLNFVSLILTVLCCTPSNLNSSLFKSCSRKAKKDTMQCTDKQFLKYNKTNAIQKYTANSPMFANSPIRTTPRLRQSLQSSIYINIQCS